MAILSDDYQTKVTMFHDRDVLPRSTARPHNQITRFNQIYQIYNQITKHNQNITR